MQRVSDCQIVANRKRCAKNSRIDMMLDELWSCEIFFLIIPVCSSMKNVLTI